MPFLMCRPDFSISEDECFSIDTAALVGLRILYQVFFEIHSKSLHSSLMNRLKKPKMLFFDCFAEKSLR
jgi:hypothetical protein